MTWQSNWAMTRRELLCRMGTGLGMLGLAGLLREADMLGSSAQAATPLAPKAPHFPGRAKHVIHIYLNGGPSQIDTFDPKPLLHKYAGQMLPTGNLTTERRTGTAFASPYRFKKYGRSGI